MDFVPDALIAGAVSLQPALAEAARQIDQHGQTEESLARLAQAGLFRHPDGATPASALRTRMEVGRALARSCASSAWLVTAYGLGAALAARMAAAPSDLGADAKIAVGDDATAATLVPDGAAWRLDGSWEFVVGAQFADWFVLPCGDRLVLVRRNQVELTPADHLGGMRGAGLATVTARKIGVAATSIFDRGDGFDLVATLSLLGPILGCAEAGHRDYVAITRKRVSGVGGEAVARMTQVQARLGAAQAELNSALVGFTSLQDRFARIEAEDGFPDATELTRDAAFIARQSLQSLTALIRQMGAMGLAESNPVQREYRDLRAMVTDHRFNESARMAAYGRLALGIEPAATVTASAA